MAVTVEPPELPDGDATTAVSIVEGDPDLVAGIPAEDLDLARRVLTRHRYDVPKGPWSSTLLRGHDEGAFAVLVLDGAVVRQIDVADRHATQILGPGDVFQLPRDDSLLDCPVTWTALQPSSMVVLDGRFTRASQRWPSLGVNLQRRLLDQADRLALHAAILQLPRVDGRILAFLWHLAERWGRVTPFGVAVPLRLTHESLGRLVGAQRPTVTLALRDLGQTGALTRSVQGDWLLSRDSRRWLRPGTGEALAAR